MNLFTFGSIFMPQIVEYERYYRPHKLDALLYSYFLLSGDRSGRGIWFERNYPSSIAFSGNTD